MKRGRTARPVPSMADGLRKVMRPRAQAIALASMIALSTVFLLVRERLPSVDPAFGKMSRVMGESGVYPPLTAIFDAPHALILQAGAGVACGIVLAGLPLFFVFRWSVWREMIDRAVAPLRLSVSNIALVAAVAGVGEELLFRAVLQPVIGLWLANVAFTLAHFVPQRYSDSFGTPRSRLVQGLVGFVVIFVIGWVLGVLFARLGLAAAMIAHFVTDLVVFLTYHRMYRWDQPSGVTPPVT